MLIGVVLLGALADWVMLRRIRPQRQGIALIAVGLLCALWVVKGQVGGDYGPLGDWGQGSVQLLEIPNDSEVNDNILAYWRPKLAMNAGTEDGAMPAKVSDRVRAMVTAGLAKLVELVNQYAAVM